MTRARRPAAAARGHPAHGLRRQEIARARISCSISISPAASRGPRARSPASTVVEVGPGPGGLTRALLARGAASVIAVERDERAIGALAEIAERYPGPARHRRSRRADVRPADAVSIAARAHRRQSALQHRDRAARLLADAPSRGRPGTTGRPHVPARSRRAHRRGTRLEDLRPAVGAGAMALHRAHPVRRQRFGLRAAAEGHLVAGTDHAFARRRCPAIARASRRRPRPPSASAARCCAKACARSAATRRH